MVSGHYPLYACADLFQHKETNTWLWLISIQTVQSWKDIIKLKRWRTFVTLCILCWVGFYRWSRNHTSIPPRLIWIYSVTNPHSYCQAEDGVSVLSLTICAQMAFLIIRCSYAWCFSIEIPGRNLNTPSNVRFRPFGLVLNPISISYTNVKTNAMTKRSV